MAVAVERIRAAIAAGTRICVHGDYDVDGICATALAVLTLRELGADVDWHLPSRFEEGYGVSGDTISRLADEGCALLLTVDCGITAVEEVAAAKARGLEVIVTDHHRPGEVLPDCPIVATRPSDYPFPELCGTGVVCKLAQALGVDVAPYLDLVALATIADVVPLLDENRSLAIAGLRALARTQRPGLQALMRNARVDPPRSTPPPSASGSRRGSTRPAASAGPTPRSSCCSRPTPTRRAARRRARDAEPRPPGRRGPDPSGRGRRGRVVARGEAAAPRLRDLGRGLARGRDRDRRLAARRALQPARRPDRRHRRRLEGLGPLAARLRPARRARRLLRSTCERFGGHRAAAGLSIDPADLEAFAEAFAAHADAVPRRRGPRAGDADRRDRARVGAHARPRRRARAARAVRPRQPRRDAARAGLRGGPAGRRRRGQAPPLPHPPGRPRRGHRDRVRARPAARPPRSGPGGTTSPAG